MTSADASSRPSSGSILYALGGLTQKVDEHGKAIEAIPSRVLEGISPRLNALESSSKSHGKRLGALEKEQWLTRGGVTLAAVLIGWAVAATKPFGVHLG